MNKLRGYYSAATLLGSTETKVLLSFFLVKTTFPSTNENKVWSLPMPTFEPGWNFVPLCLTIIFPAIIFPAIFLDESGSILIENNPKIMAAFIAALIGIFSRSIIATIFSGLASYWFLIFVV